MKSILMSFKPQTVARILNGEQTKIIAKSTPKEVPFKVYVYCTAGQLLYENFPNGKESREIKLAEYKVKASTRQGHALNGKVVAEFVCDRIDKSDIPNYPDEMVNDSFNMTFGELKKYAKGKRVKLLRIADLKVYDKPRELNDFRPYCNKKEKCWKDVVRHCDDVFSRKCMDLVINKPPRSWQYVEVEK